MDGCCGIYGKRALSLPYPFRSGRFLSCPMCRRHLSSFWISLGGTRSACSCVFRASKGRGKLRHLLCCHLGDILLPILIQIWNDIWKKSVQAWRTVGEEMAIEKRHGLLAWCKTKNGGLRSDVTEHTINISPVSRYAQNVKSSTRPWTNDFRSYGWTALEVRTLSGGFAHWDDQFSQCPFKDFDERGFHEEAVCKRNWRNLICQQSTKVSSGSRSLSKM